MPARTTRPTTTRHPAPFTDPDGTPCVRVPLANGRDHAELYADDYADLIARGVTGNWQAAVPNRVSRSARRPYVQCFIPTTYARPGGLRWTTQTVARLIAQAGNGLRVRYRDGNTLNLRRCNLEIAHGYARRAAEDFQHSPKQDGSGTTSVAA